MVASQQAAQGEKMAGGQPRLMFAIVHFPKDSITIGMLVGHAPHEGDDDAAKDEWWGLLCVTFGGLRKKYPALEWSLMLDANARVGSVDGFGIGPAYATKENNNGFRFRCFLKTHTLYAINTFHETCGHTWTSSRGHESRIDYMVATPNLVDGVVRCDVTDDIDLSFNDTDDHRAVIVEFAVARDAHRPHNNSTSFFRINKLNLNVIWRQEGFQREVWSFQPSPLLWPH